MNNRSDSVKIIYAEDVPQQDSRPVAWHCKFDGTEMGNSSFVSVHWVNVQPRQEAKPGMGHPPHMHKETEIIMLIGTDPEHPDDLGGEVELCVGEKMEKLVISKSCTILIPGGTPHGNYRVVETHRPWLFAQVQEAAPRTEKFLWDYMTPEEIAAIPDPGFWKDAGYDD